ncbi:hypothetical protein GCM10029964_041780 [Kibdelosporangium lantanae]
MNTVFLFTIVVLPFATRVLGERGASSFGTVFYAVTVAAVGLSMLGLLRVVRRHGAVDPDADPAWPARMIRGILVPVCAFVVSIPIAFFASDVVKYLWVPLWLVFEFVVGAYQRLRGRHT